MRRIAILLTLVWLLAAAAPADAQPLAAFTGPVAEADLLYFGGHVEEAYELLLSRYADEPTDGEVPWRIARAGAVVGVLREGVGGYNHYYDTALHFGRLAVERTPDDADALYWRGVAAGRRALHAGTGYAAELAQLVYDDAHAVLATDSLHAGAHNMLGKLAFEVMSLSRVERLLARVFLSNDALERTSWEDAEHHLGRAVELSPSAVLYHYDLGVLHARRGRPDEAVASLRQALALPAVQPMDEAVQELAGTLLEEIAN